MCDNTAELDVDVIEKAFVETPSYEKKLQEAREKHLGTLVDFNTFEVIYEEDFVNEKALSTVWVDKSPDGNEAKSRLCVRSYEQHLQKDVSFFSQTPSSVSLRMVLPLAHQRSYDTRCGDISAASLHAEINEWKGPAGAFWPLLRTLFGLRRSMKDWNIHFTSVMAGANFVQNRAEPCLYSRTDETGTTIVYVHVDDLLIVAPRAPPRSSASISRSSSSTRILAC